MERIKLAIEKARADAMTEPELRSVQPVVDGVARMRILRRDTPSDIVYTRTRTVSLDPAHLARNRIIAANREDPDASAFDLLRTQLLHEVADKGWRTVAVTAPSSGCGKSTVAANLAFSIARQESPTVLLADFDLRRTKISACLGLDVNTGLSAYLHGTAELPDTLVNPTIPGLTILPNEKHNENAAETLATAKVKNLVSELSTRYESRLLICNISPLLDGDDALAFLPNVDSVLLVIANGKTKKAELEESLRLLRDKNMVGVVVNEPCSPRRF